MALATYSDLKSSVADWLNRDDLTAVIPDFISLAEAKFNRSIRTSDMIGRATLSTANDYFDLPVDHLEPISLKQTGVDVPQIEYVVPDELNELRLKTVTSNTLRYYSIVGKALHIIPAPSAATTVELTYYKKIPTLSDANTSNWLLSRSPDVYLYGALMQAEPYLKNDERVSLWATGLGQGIEELNLESDRNRYPRGGVVARKRTFG